MFGAAPEFFFVVPLHFLVLTSTISYFHFDALALVMTLAMSLRLINCRFIIIIIVIIINGCRILLIAVDNA